MTRPAARPPTALRARDVAELTVASGHPCISVLKPTRPKPRMTPTAAQQLHSLATGRRTGRHADHHVHDLVDGLMEQVILHGGQLDLVQDGDLDEHGRIALISRRRHRPAGPRPLGPGRPGDQHHSAPGPGTLPG